MIVAQQRIVKFVAWIERNSLSRRAPVGNDIHVFGKFATIVPVDFADAPPTEWHPECLPLYIDTSLADGLRLPVVDLGDSPSQPHPLDRLGSIIFHQQDYTGVAPCGLFPLTDPAMPIQAAIDARGGLAGLDPAVFPVIAVPIWQFSFNQRRSLLTNLPFRPKADAIDGPDGPWHTPIDSAPRTLNFGLKFSWPT